jgi:hypothetical protein
VSQGCFEVLGDVNDRNAWARRVARRKGPDPERSDLGFRFRILSVRGRVRVSGFRVQGLGIRD